MTSVDKAAIAWSIAIVAVGAGFAFAGGSFDVSFTTPTTPSSIQDEKISTAKQEILAAEREQAMEEQKTSAMEIEDEVSISSPTIEKTPIMAGPMTVEVSIPTGTAVPGCEETNACYLPASVSINAGDTVVWSNDDTAAHTVTSGSPTEGPDGIFDSSLVMVGKTFEVTFDDTGSYDYFCMVHPWMKGTVQAS